VKEELKKLSQDANIENEEEMRYIDDYSNYAYKWTVPDTISH